MYRFARIATEGLCIRQAFLSIAVMLVCTAPVRAQDAVPPPNPSFDILEFDVDGNSVLAPRDIERAVYPFLGEKKHFADVEGARKALEELYQKLGYQTVFVEIPEQQVVGGVIRLHVAQGEIGRVRVTGTRYYSLGEIRTRVAEFSPGSVPDFNVMQEQLAQVNKLPDRQVAPILTPGRVPGTVDVELSVKDNLPLHGDVSLDNYASPFTTALRANAALHYDNLWQQQHSLAVNWQVAPEKPSDTNVGYATYLWRFAERDDVLSFYGIRSNSRVAVIGSSTIVGDGTIYGMRWIKPLGSGGALGGTFFNSMTLGIDHKAFGQTDISYQTDTANVLPAISYVPLSASYGALLVRPDATMQLTLGMSSAPRSVFGNSDAEFEGRRVAGGASWVAWKYDASLESWLGSRFGAYARISGQWTADPLIVNEQFAVGGAESVRGYKESEIIGDHGFQATIEARYHPWGRPAADAKRSLYALAFFDAGGIGLVDPLGPQVSSTTIASTGFGFRARGWHGLSLSSDAALALRNGGSAPGGYITPKHKTRIDFSLGYGF